jgi:hypothetical protein
MTTLFCFAKRQLLIHALSHPTNAAVIATLTIMPSIGMLLLMEGDD